MNLIIATEDELSEIVAERIIATSKSAWIITARMRRGGSGYLRSRIHELLRTAEKVPVFLLTDLDLKPCAPALIQEWIGNRPLPTAMKFRIAVREVEAWLLADPEGLCAFFGIPLDRAPINPEEILDPKQELLRLVAKYSPRSIRDEVLPKSRSTAKVGVGYNATMGRFVRESWDPHRAAIKSNSLARTMQRI